MKDALFSQFAFGFYVGFALCVMAMWHLWKLKREHSRYKRMLADKMEIEAAAVSKMKGDLEAAKKENENLRIKVQTQNAGGGAKLERELEIFARAEKKMTIAAPGFAGPWEQAKQAAHQEIADEDTGKAAPKRLFQRFFGGAVNVTETQKSLPAEAKADAAQV